MMKKSLISNFLVASSLCLVVPSFSDLAQAASTTISDGIDADAGNLETMPTIGGITKGGTIIGTPGGNGSSTSIPTSTSPSNLVLTDDLITKADPFIKIINGQFTITDEIGLLNAIGFSYMKIVKDQIAQSNTTVSQIDRSIFLVNGNTITTTASAQVTDSSTTPSTSTGSNITNETNNSLLINSATTSSTREGINAIKFYWWGYKVWLSRSTVNKILNVGVQGGAAALGAAIGGVGGAVAGAIVGAIFTEFVTGPISRPIWMSFWYPNMLRDFGFQ